MEPFGDERADLRAGVIAATIANAATHGRANFKPTDFVLTFGERRQGVEEMQAILMNASRQAVAKKKESAKRGK